MRSDRYKDEYLNEVAEETVTTDQASVSADVGEFTNSAEEDKKGTFGLRHKKEASNEPEELDLTKMKKRDLLEIMLAQGKEIDRLNAKVADLESQLANREFEFSRIGSIAEASLAVTNIFKEAEEAARIYMENIRRRCEQKK